MSDESVTDRRGQVALPVGKDKSVHESLARDRSSMLSDDINRLDDIVVIASLVRLK